MATKESLITQVSQGGAATDFGPMDTFDYNNEADIRMNVRGQMFSVSRDELMSLPESILLCLFPNGVFMDQEGNVITHITPEDVVYVDFSPECFEYVLDTFRAAGATQDVEMNEPVGIQDTYPPVSYDADVLRTKPSIVVLREDLDYYCIPPEAGCDLERMRAVKRAVGEHIVKQNLVFAGLGKNNELGTAEHHLLDMLCSSGFSLDGFWGHRTLEPGKTVVTSLSLVSLHGGGMKSQQHVAAGSGVAQPEQQEHSASVSHKLLLFWRKPARKCWWSMEKVAEIPQANGKLVNVHIRRVWTLELVSGI